MNTDRSELDELKAKTDLVAVFKHYGLTLKKVGRNYFCHCPFHPGDDTPSLSINPEANLWNCLGCEAGGDVFSLVQLKEELKSFPEVLERVRALSDNGCAAKPEAKKSVRVPLPEGLTRSELLGRVMDRYQKALKESKPAQAYLKQRGLDSREVWETFRIGYCPGDLRSSIPSKGPIPQALTQLGVLNEQGQDHFRGCIVIPLEHPDEGIVGLYGRQIDPESSITHLYLPGPKRGVFHWQALKRQARPLFVTESILDALSLYQAGIHEVTCLYGASAWPEDFKALLARFAVNQLTLCLDQDQAGIQARERLAAELAEQTVSCDYVELRGGKDPNQILQEQGPESLAQMLRNQTPIAFEKAPDDGQVERTPEGFVLQFGEVSYRVSPYPPFNGRLRVTVMAHKGKRIHPDKLDLYSDRARGMAATQLARRLELTKAEAERHLLQMLLTAERWVEEAAQEKAVEQGSLAQKKAPELTPAEKAAALSFLRDPNLVERILEDTLALGFMGEDEGKLLAYLIGISRKQRKPLAGIIRSQSGAGKSHLTEMVEMLTPPEDILFYSRITPQSLYYMPRDAMRHKILILEERAGGESADYSIRTLLSRKKLVLLTPIKDPITGKMGSGEYEVDGPIAYLETTTCAELNPENTTRCFEIGLDESEAQTRRIHEWQRQLRKPEQMDQESVMDEICLRHHNAQRMLHKIGVAIPFVDKLSFPSRWLRTRRDHEKFLILVESVAFLHQHQRERRVTERGNAYILATWDDYRIAYKMAQKLLKMTLDELSPNARELHQLILQMARSAHGDFVFTRRELMPHTSHQDHRLRALLKELVEMEFLGVLDGKKNGQAAQFRVLVTQEEPGSSIGALTTPEALRQMLDPKSVKA